MSEAAELDAAGAGGVPDLDLPSVDEVKKTTSPAAASEAPRERWTSELAGDDVRHEAEYAHLKGLRDHYHHKGKWSWFLMGLMGWMVAFQCVLLWMVGAKIWDFTPYKWLLPALLAQNFAQIVGLALWVVKALFRDLG